MSITQRSDAAVPSRRPVESPVESAMVVLLAIGMTILPYVVVSSDRGVWQFGATLAFVDIVAFTFAMLHLHGYVGRVRSRELRAIEWGGLGFAALSIATCAVHPSMRGVVFVARIASCLVISSWLVTAAHRNRMRLVRWLGIAAVAQTAIALTQRVTRSALGLGFLGETLYPFRPGYPVPTGTMRDPYPLAGFGLFVAAVFGVCLARRWVGGRLPWLVIACGGALAGLSGSRAAFITLALVAAALLIAAPRGIVVAAVLSLGFVAVAVPSNELWLGRRHNATSTGASDVSNGRSALNAQAFGLMRRDPLVGVGPGNYSTAVRAVPKLAAKSPTGGILPVHNMVLLAVAENGVGALVPIALVAGAFVLAALRRRARWLPLLCAIGPYLMLDLVYWFYPEGLLMLAIAIALVCVGDLAAPTVDDDAIVRVAADSAVRAVDDGACVASPTLVADEALTVREREGAAR